MPEDPAQPESPPAPDASGSQDAASEILKAGRAFCEQLVRGGTEALQGLLNRTVAYEPGETQIRTAAEALTDVEDQAVLSTIVLSGTREGRLHLVMPAQGAKAIAASITALAEGSEPDPEHTELDADGMDAYTEAVNQFLGNAAQALRETIEGDVKLLAESTRVVDFEASPPAVELGTDAWIHHSASLTIERLDPTPAHLLASASVTGQELPADAEAPPPREAEAAPALAQSTELNRTNAMRLQVPVVVVLANKKVRMEVVQTLAPGSIIEFRKQSGELLDLCVDKTKIAEGEVIITSEHFGIQVRKLVDVRAAVSAGK